jgi:hypothetical protein
MIQRWYRSLSTDDKATLALFLGGLSLGISLLVLIKMIPH